MNLDTEILDGYEVSAFMKRIWEKELSLLQQFVMVCNRNNLQYRIGGGTLLGAVRHKGFIPWDNDIDVWMFRKDFDKLLEIGEKEFNGTTFFQTPFSENGKYFATYLKLRDKESTAASINEFDQGINCGIFIDVFCLDELPNGKLRRWWYLYVIHTLSKMRRFCLNIPPQKGWVSIIKYHIQKLIWVLIGCPNASELYRLYQKAAGSWQGKDCCEVAHLDFGYHDKFVWQKSDWDACVMLPFQDDMLCAPAGYERILRTQYGDYMRFPEDKSTHDYFDFNPDIPYKEYFSKKHGNK